MVSSSLGSTKSGIVINSLGKSVKNNLTVTRFKISLYTVTFIHRNVSFHFTVNCIDYDILNVRREKPNGSQRKMLWTVRTRR